MWQRLNFLHILILLIRQNSYFEGQRSTTSGCTDLGISKLSSFSDLRHIYIYICLSCKSICPVYLLALHIDYVELEFCANYYLKIQQSKAEMLKRTEGAKRPGTRVVYRYKVYNVYT